MRALVLGGSRFVGLSLVQELLERGHQVAVFNRGQTAAELPAAVQRLQGDRKDPQQVRAALAGRDFDVVYDVSGYVPEDTGIMVEIFAGRAGHYVYTSTAAVYERRWYAPVTEDFPYNEVEGGDYARGKIATERLLLQAHRERGFPSSIVRPWMVFGPGNPLPAREQLWFRRIGRGRRVLLPGNGYTHMQYGHVRDLARAFVQMGGNPQTFGQSYNVTGPDLVTMNGYVQLISALTERDVEVVYLDVPEAAAAAAKDRNLLPFPWQYGRIPSIQKAKEDFGFWPSYNAEQCTADTYRWYKEQELDTEAYDFSYEDQLLAQYGGDPKRSGRITASGEMPQVGGG
ncbi:MAG: SDR family oxidoreductase [Chloroflexi bacterium]|nr:SDR family oxidoreductase [Chloroflexota bacterium]